MSWLRESLAKATMYEADKGAGDAPAATLDAGDAEAGSDGDAADGKVGDGDGGGEKKAPDYLSSIPKEFREHKAFLEHEDLSSFLKKSLEDSDKLADFDSEKVLEIPGDDAGDDVREAFYRKLGKPETADGYELDDPGFPDGLPRDEELEGHIKKWAHEANIPADALKHLVGKYNALVSEIFTAAKAEEEKELVEKSNALKTELKDGYNEFVLKAQRAADKLGGEEFITLLKDYGLESHPTFLKVFGKLGKMISDDSALGGGAGSGEGGVAPTGFDGKERMTYEADKPKKE